MNVHVNELGNMQSDQGVHLSTSDYKALVDALRSMTSGLADHLKAGTVRCDSCADEVKKAHDVLAKVAAKQ